MHRNDEFGSTLWLGRGGSDLGQFHSIEHGPAVLCVPDWLSHGNLRAKIQRWHWPVVLQSVHYMDNVSDFVRDKYDLGVSCSGSRYNRWTAHERLRLRSAFGGGV